MTPTLISLISILIGIIAANLSVITFKRYSLGIIGNTISGVFGSILFIKSFGRLGFDPMSIISSGTINYILLLLNFTVSFCGACLFLVFISLLKTKLFKVGEN